MQDCVVALEDVSLIYHEPHAETLAIDHISFTVSDGEFIAIVGPSGCGKTSVLNLLAGLMTPSDGTVRLMGHSISETDQTIGYMLQQDHLLPWRTIEGNVLLGLEVKHLLNAETRSHALKLLETYGLSAFRQYYPRQLSGGMRQKVALIRTLAFEPRLLLLDEPFSALDYQTRLHLADEIHAIIRSEKKTAILVTHDISEAISMADRIFVLTARPAKIKSVHEIRLTAPDIPFARRSAPEFKDYFETIWKEIDAGEKS